MKKGNIPVLMVQGETLPETWERSVLLLWKKGVEVRTEYDRPGDAPSKDCTMTMIVRKPMAEPRIHRALPTGLKDLEIYRLEVVEGIHDDRVGPKGWSYTYHERLAAYRRWENVIDQIEFIVRKLTEAPYTRRAQAITWKPFEDPFRPEPPCLQRVWCRLLPDSEDQLVLNMNAHWRSRDALNAAFMNMFAFVDLQRMLALRLKACLNREVKIGRYTDISDSYHIYGKDFKKLEKLLTAVEKRSFEERTWTTAFAEPYFQEARRELIEAREK